MSDESITRHLEQPQVGTLKLSEAIRIGGQRLREETSWLNGDGCGCVIAMAAVAFGADPHRHQHMDETYRLVSKQTDLPVSFLRGVEFRHNKGEKALSIADWLESQGL